MSDEQKKGKSVSIQKRSNEKKQRRTEDAGTSSAYTNAQRSSMSLSSAARHFTRYKVIHQPIKKRATISISSTRGEKPMRLVAASRMFSRDILQPAASSSFSSNHRESALELDMYDKKLASYAKSVTTLDTQRRISSFRLFQRNDRTERSYSLTSQPDFSNDAPSDLDIIFRDTSEEEGMKRKYNKPRSNWLRKLEKIAERNEAKAKIFTRLEEELMGDICCCPMFTTHLFFASNFKSRKFFGFKVEKPAKVVNLQETVQPSTSKADSEKSKISKRKSVATFKHSYHKKERVVSAKSRQSLNDKTDQNLSNISNSKNYTQNCLFLEFFI